MITLIRHGQAGSRLVYDELSELGHEQARALGAWLGERGVTFDAVVAGGLERQRQTVATLASAMRERGGFCPEPVVDLRWNEFDLDAVYTGLGPRLAETDAQFRLEYEELSREIVDPAAAAHRAWRKCDVAVVRAWIEGQFGFDGESWADFCGRIREAFRGLPAQGNIAVVTSATPVALCAGAALDLTPLRVMHLAGAQRNSAFSEIDPRPGDPRLVSFNNIPHLHEERLRTFR